MQDDQDSGDQEPQKKEEEQGQANVEDSDQVSKKIEHPVDLIVMPLPENPIRLSEIKSIVSEVSQEDHVVEVPCIDLIFRDQRWKLEDCTKIWQVLQLQSLMRKAHIRAKCKH